MASNPNKLYKKALIDQQRRIKPKECQKYVRVVLDTTFSCSNFGRELLLELTTLNLNHVTRSIGENCVCWERNAGQREFISNDNLAVCNDEWDLENQVIKIVKAAELKMHVQQKTLLKLCKEFRAAFPGKSLTIVVPRVKDKDNELVSEHAKAYVELQLLEGISVIELTPSATEVASLLGRFTKAIAEVPYKQQKSESLGAFKKYVANDKKQCVRVAGRIGFGRLWQQHLNRLPLVTLDVAEAIIARYSCPKQLINTYKDNSNAVEEIANLRLNRSNCPQPLQTDRRIGNALSTKLYTLYNSRDPNACI